MLPDHLHKDGGKKRAVWCVRPEDGRPVNVITYKEKKGRVIEIQDLEGNGILLHVGDGAEELGAALRAALAWEENG